MKTKSKPKPTQRRKPEKTATTNGVKAAAMELVRKLPADSTWDDLMYRIYVRQQIEEGIRDADAGNLVPHEEVFKEYGL